jgi:hypothetical protein
VPSSSGGPARSDALSPARRPALASPPATAGSAAALLAGMAIARARSAVGSGGTPSSGRSVVMTSSMPCGNPWTVPSKRHGTVLPLPAPPRWHRATARAGRQDTPRTVRISEERVHRRASVFGKGAVIGQLGQAGGSRAYTSVRSCAPTSDQGLETMMPAAHWCTRRRRTRGMVRNLTLRRSSSITQG